MIPFTMFEGKPESFSQKTEVSDSERIDQLDRIISDILDGLEKSGLDVHRWETEYENLPEEVEAFEQLYNRLKAFETDRQDALMSFEFTAEMTDQEKEDIRRFDREVMASFQDQERFLGNGASAEVYGMNANEAICVKFITNQERYDENNHLRVEYETLSHVYEKTKHSEVRTPFPIFLRIHPKEGHSYGMEKIDGASLSQILEFPEKFAEMVEVAKGVDREKIKAQLEAFVLEMHEAGFTHGDLFKRNLMLDREGRLYVIDFGKSKRIEFKGELEEQRKSDIYSAGHSLRDFFTQLDELTKEVK